MSGEISRRSPVTISDSQEEREHARVVNGRLWVDVISGPGGSGGEQHQLGTSVSGTDLATGAGFIDINGRYALGAVYTQTDIDSTPTGFVAMGKTDTDDIKAIRLGGDGTVQIGADSPLPLSADAATASNQILEIGHLQILSAGQATDDITTHATGVTKGPVIMAAATPTDAAVNANDIGAVAMTLDRRLHVSVQDSALPAGAATSANQATEITSLQLIDDIVYTDDTSTHATGTSKGALVMAAATPTDAAVNANDIGAVAMTLDRKLHVSVQDALPAGSANIGDVDIVSLPNEGQQTMANSISVAIASDQAAYYFVTTLTNVNTVYDDSPTSATSGGFTVTPWRKFMLSFELVKTATPTDILFTVQYNNGATWCDYRNNFWGQILYDDVATATKIARCFSGDCVGTQMRVKVVATGTSSTNKFTVTNARVECKN